MFEFVDHVRAKPPRDSQETAAGRQPASDGEESDAAVSAHHEHQLFSSIQAFHGDALLYDVELCIGSESIRAHKLVLAAYSGFFKSMFTNEMKECYAKKIQLQETDYHNFSSIVSYMYTSRIPLTDENVEKVLEMSVVYQIASLEHICQKYLISCISEANYVKYLLLADLYNCSSLLRAVRSFVYCNFVQLSLQREVFCTIPSKFLQDILASGSLRVLSELQVYQAFRVWMCHDPARLSHFKELSACIKFPLIPLRHTLVEIYNDAETCFKEHSPLIHQIITECSRLRQTVLENTILQGPCEPKESARAVTTVTNTVTTVTKTAADTLYKYFPEPYHSRRTGWDHDKSYIYIFGGINDEQEYSSTFESYDVSSNKWLHKGRMLSQRSASCAVYYAGNVILAGGLDETERHKPTDSVDVLCLATETWTPTTRMKQARSVFGLNSLFGLVYGIGGHIGDSYTTAVEVFDPIKEQWCACSPLRARHGCFSSSVLEGCIYCMGGFSRSNEYDYGDVVERFDPRVGRWSYAASLCTTRAAHQSVVIDSKIYVFGGTYKNGFTTDVEVFDPRQNVWSQITPGPPDLSSTCMCVGVVGRTIYIAGGRNPSSREHEAVDSLIAYNVDSNEWEYKEHMIEKRMFSSSVTI